MELKREDGDEQRPEDERRVDLPPADQAPSLNRNEIVPAPSLLPARVLAGDALAQHGLRELAKRAPRVEMLPSLLPIHGHCVVSDEESECVYVLGGWSSEDLWAFHFRTQRWQAISTGRFVPDATGIPAVGFDARRRRLIWFGGWPAGQKFPTDDLYVIDCGPGRRWEWRYIEHRHPWPLPRNGATLVLDTRRDRGVLFGGDAGPGTSFTPLNDLWTLDLRSLQWQRHDQPRHRKGPSARWLHAAAHDAQGDRMILFGGGGWGRFDAQVHALNLETMVWELGKSSSGALPCMEGHAMVCVPEANALYVYGGLLLRGDGPSSLPYLWQVDLRTLRSVQRSFASGIPPRGRFCHAACYCRHLRAMFCFGGKWNQQVGNYYATDGELHDAFLIHLE